MKPLLLESAFVLPLPRATVFPFFADAENLEALTPAELHFEIRTPRPIVMRTGARIDYRLRLFGCPIGWKSEITLWNPPHEFIDTQLQGPYAEWVHHHVFEDRGSSTVLRDRVAYRLPLEPFGRIAAPLVRRELARIFDFRRRAVARRFGVEAAPC